jgi:hypothetical protein
MCANGDEQGSARLVVVAACGIQDCQIVVGLGQPRVILGQGGKEGDGLLVSSEFGQHHTSDEPSLRIALIRRELRIDLG